MKRILGVAVCVLALSVFYTGMAIADEAKAKADAQAGLTTGSINSPIVDNSGGGKAQAIPVQEIPFVFPMNLFVNAEDLRNIMTIFKFVHEHPAPYRWELERWARRSSSKINISSKSDCLKEKNRYDQILFTFNVNLVRYTYETPKIDKADMTPKELKIISEAMHMGNGTGNTTTNIDISVQNLCKFALEALDSGHNIFEILAQVVATEVRGKASGLSIGGGLSNVNGGGTAFTIPALIGWARGSAGKVGLEGIQAELYYKPIISFKEDAATTRRYIEVEIWGKKKPQPQPKAEAPPPPPSPKAEVPVPPDCRAEKEEIKGLNEMLREANDKLNKAEQEKIVVPPPCPVSIEFSWNSWIVRPDQEKNLAEMGKYIAQYAATVKKLGGEFTLIGHADETVAKALDSPDKDYVNPRLGQQRSRMTKVGLGTSIIKAGGKAEQVAGIAPLSAGRDTPVISHAGKEAKNRQVYLVVTIPGVRGYNEPK